MKSKEVMYYGIQTYFQDEWVNTDYKTLGEIKKEAKKFGDGEVKHMYLDSFHFHTETYYYIDSCGHTVLFRCITEFNKEIFDKAAEKGVIQKSGRQGLSFETMEREKNENNKTTD